MMFIKRLKHDPCQLRGWLKAAYEHSSDYFLGTDLQKLACAVKYMWLYGHKHLSTAEHTGLKGIFCVGNMTVF